MRAIDGMKVSSIKAFGIEKTLGNLRKIEQINKGKFTKAYAQYTLGSIYEKELKDKMRAVEEYKKVLEKYPDTRDDFFKLGPADMAEEKLEELTKKQ